MTNKLEKQFFDTFGIEPIEIPSREYDSDGEICSYYVEYPQITDTHYLKLICILHTTNIVQLCTTNVENLKEEVLLTLCYWVDKRDIKHQVRTLFEEG